MKPSILAWLHVALRPRASRGWTSGAWGAGWATAVGLARYELTRSHSSAAGQDVGWGCLSFISHMTLSDHPIILVVILWD